MKTDIVHKLSAMGLFAEFTEPEISTLLELAETVRANKGEQIVTQDTPGDSMFLIVDGRARVIHRTGDQRIELAILSAGEFFGELALVDHGPRCADVEADDDCLLLKLPQASIRALAGVYPNAAFKFLIAVGRVLVTRMRSGNKKYIDSLLMGAEVS